MERKEFETELCAKLEDIRAFYLRYNPNAFEGKDHLSIIICNDIISAHNIYWENPKPVDFWRTKDNPIFHNI